FTITIHNCRHLIPVCWHCHLYDQRLTKLLPEYSTLMLAILLALSSIDIDGYHKSISSS
ncbi:hypothetical protein C0J52_05898, partial [Blattella germanica]